MKTFLALATILASMTLVFACTGGSTLTPMPTPTPTQPPTPSPTPIPTSTPTPSPVPGPQEVTRAYLSAVNAGDIDALREIYAEDVVFTLANSPNGPAGEPTTDSYSGIETVIAAHSQSFGDNAKITLSDTGVVGNAFTGVFSYTDDGFDAGGIGPLTGTWETVVQGGEVTSVTMTFDKGTYERWKSADFPATTSLRPIVLSDGVTGLEVMEQIPAEEGECIHQSIGDEAYGKFLRSDFSSDSSQLADEVFSLCLSSESISRVFVGFVMSQLGGLGDVTIPCMFDALGGQELQAIFVSETAWGEAFQAMTGCLNDEEKLRLEQSQTQQELGTPGLVDVDGRQLYLTCEGESGPTVIMEAGGRGNSGSWRLVQPEVAQFTRVCAYDRAGTGYSESVAPNGTAQAIADELHSLLVTAGIDGPYVLVGHSLGGIIARVFADRHLSEIAGMVLVDTGHGDPEVRFQEVLTPEEWQRVRSVIRHDDQGFTLPGGLGLLGPDLGDRPLVVLSAGRMQVSPLPADVVEKLDQVRLKMREELLCLSLDSTHVIAEKSGHSIQNDQPDLVVEAIRQVVDAARSR